MSIRYPILCMSGLLLCAGLSAQESVWGSSSTSSNATAVSEPGLEADGSYVVKKWDTLWDLSQKFLRDPWRWRDIWSLNQQVSNPDLIFPGNKLRIPGLGGDVGTSSAATSQSPLSAPADGEKPRALLETPDFASLTNGLNLVGSKAEQPAAAPKDTVRKQMQPESEFVETKLLQSLISKGYFSGDFVSRVGMLWFDKDAKGRQFPGNGMIDKCKEENVYRQFDEFAATSYTSGAYHVGDTVDVIHSDRFVKFGAQTANLVRSTAQARVSSVSGAEVRAELFRTWDVIRCGDRIAPVKRSGLLEIDGMEDPASAIAGTVFERVETTESPYLHQTFIVNKGSSAGVRMGDIFAVYPVTKKVADVNASVAACVVRVQDGCCTCVIVKMFANRVSPGDEVRLIKRIRFK